MRILAVIPAYNEEENVQAVVENFIRCCPGVDYLVVNDGSTDRTAAICRQEGLNLLDLPINTGLAGAFQAGMRYAWQHAYDAVLQFDADGQHLPQYVPDLATALEEGYDIAIGSRYVTVNKPISLRMFGSFLISFAIRAVANTAICDPTSGMRLYGSKVIERFAKGVNYTPEPDTLAFLIRCGARVKEVQVEMAPRRAGKSYFNLQRSMAYMLQMSVSILLVQWFRRNEIDFCPQEETA